MFHSHENLLGDRVTAAAAMVIGWAGRAPSIGLSAAFGGSVPVREYSAEAGVENRKK